MRIAIASDTHLSPRTPEATANWDTVVQYVAATGPDLVLHLGDLSLDGASAPDDLRHARGQLDRLAVPCHVIPGNHDIGDNPAPGVDAADVIDEERLARWHDLVGPDHFCLRGPGWTVVAINAQLLGSGLPAEAAQWRWLEDQLRPLASGDRIALLTHKPVTAPDAELANAPHYRFVPPDARRRLRELSASRPFALVASGHVHQYRVIELDGTCHVWAPTTWAVLPERIQPTFGSKRSGIVTLVLDADHAVTPEWVAPDGLVQLTLHDDLPVPYPSRGR